MRADVPGLGDQLHPGQHRVGAHRHQERVVGVVAVLAAGQRGGQVEPEPVDAHLLDPVAQRVEGHLDHAGLGEVQRVAAAGGVDVLAVAVEAVVGRGVQAPPGQHRPAGVALTGVVVDDVEQHLDAGRVQVGDHGAELVHRADRVGAGCVAGVHGEEAERVVPPVVHRAAPGQVGLVDDGVHGEQLDAGHAEPGQVGDRRRVSQPGVGAAQVLGDSGQAAGQALDVRLVDHRVGPVDAGPAGVRHIRRPRPAARGCGEHSVRGERRRVAWVGAAWIAVQRVVHLMAEQLGHQGQPPPRPRAGLRQGDRPRVRVEQQLGRVVEVAAPGFPGAVGAQPVPLTDRDVADVTEPHAMGLLRQRDPTLGPAAARGRVEQTQLDPVGVTGEHRHVDTPGVGMNTQWMRTREVGGHPRQSAGRRRHGDDTATPARLGSRSDRSDLPHGQCPDSTPRLRLDREVRARPSGRAGRRTG